MSKSDGSHTQSVENGDGIDANVCCMYFVHYNEDVIEGSGADWIYCKCGRWLHEDCVEDVVKDSEGVERYCSFCVDKYSVWLILLLFVHIIFFALTQNLLESNLVSVQ